ncbi:Hok/Gef family protein [Escherichia coli]|nr:Hok/Gef family protein [Escherichia coli]
MATGQAFAPDWLVGFRHNWERLCELNIHRGNTVVQVTLAYEARK